MTLGALAITTAPAQAQEPIPGGGVGGIANGAHVPVNVGLLGGGVGGIANGAHVPVNVGLLGTAAEVGVNLR